MTQVKKSNYFGSYAKLINAINNDDLISVMDLVEKGANFNFHDGSLIYLTVEKSRLTILKFFISKGATLNSG